MHLKWKITEFSAKLFTKIKTERILITIRSSSIPITSKHGTINIQMVSRTFLLFANYFVCNWISWHELTNGKSVIVLKFIWQSLYYGTFNSNWLNCGRNMIFHSNHCCGFLFFLRFVSAHFHFNRSAGWFICVVFYFVVENTYNPNFSLSYGNFLTMLWIFQVHARSTMNMTPSAHETVLPISCN